MEIQREYLTAIVLVIFAGLLSTAAFADSMPATEIVKQLKTKGYKIIYSNRLLSDEMELDIDEVSLPAFRRALYAKGLSLKRIRHSWIVVKSQAAPVTVSGQIFDNYGHPVKGAQLVAAVTGQEAVTDTYGSFLFNAIAVGEVVHISANGFHDQEIVIEEASSLRISLQPKTLMENVIVYGKPYRLSSSSQGDTLVRLTDDELRLAPAFGGDSLRVISQLPGISSVGVSAQPRIRGGSPDEVLILLDGMELLEPFHLADYQSGFSSIDANSIESVDIYTGGFPVRYGNRMSGVIEMRTDRPDDPLDTQLGVSNFATSISTRGRLSGNRQADWILNARQGNLDELTQYLEANDNDPEFADVLARVSYGAASDSLFTLGGLYAEDDINFVDDDESDSSNVRSHYLWAGSESSRKISDKKSVYNTWNISGAQIKRTRSEISEVESDGKGGEYFHKQDTQQITLRYDRGTLFKKRRTETGFQLSYGKSEYRQNSSFDRGGLTTNLGGDRIVADNIDLTVEGLSAGAYIAAEWQYNRWTFQPSFRLDWQDYYFNGDALHGSPRLGLSYKATEDIKLWLTAGRYYQPQGVHELQVSDGIVNFFSPQSSDQAILGLEWYWQDATVKAEAYYKRYRNPKPRFENLFNPFVLLPELEPDRILINPERAKASGFDLELNYPLSTKWSAIFRYSYLDSADRVNGRWIPRRWSQRNTVFTQLGWQHNDWNIALGIRWHSGWRTSVLPMQIGTADVIPVESVFNNFELRDYFSVDLGLEKTWYSRAGRISINADVSNLTERKNLAGIDFDAEERAGQLIFTPDREKLLPLVFSAGIVIAF